MTETSEQGVTSPNVIPDDEFLRGKERDEILANRYRQYKVLDRLEIDWHIDVVGT